MGDQTRNPGELPHPPLPPCEQAQADGVPCTEVGRQCDICQRAYDEWRALHQRQADGAR